MRPTKKFFAFLAALCLVISCVFGSSQSVSAASSSKIISKTGYTLSRRTGTYTSTVKVKLTAKKGYKVYYTTGTKFSTKKVLKSKKSVTFTVKKTTKITVYAVKNNAKITSKLLAGKKVKKAARSYTYKIKKKTVTPTVKPSVKPSVAPSVTPSVTPSVIPSVTPSENPSVTPSVTPSASPSAAPSATPSASPSAAPSVTPSAPAKQQAAQSTLDSLSIEDISVEDILANVTEKSVPDLPSEDIIAISLGDTVTTTDSDKVSIVSTDSTEDSAAYQTITIRDAGTYRLTGTGKNVFVAINPEGASIAEDIHLVLDNVVIDNSAMGTIKAQDVPVISVGKKTSSIVLSLYGASALTGNQNYTKEPASAIIYAKDSASTLTVLAGESNASLTITDPMASTTDYGDCDATDGISCKGSLILQSGTFNIHSNGDCLKGTGADGTGGVTVLDGSYTLSSALGNGIKSKNGNVNIAGGTITTTYTKEDGINAKNYSINIAAGDINIDNCYGDGIQGEFITIGGENTTLKITTYFENAGINYYDKSLGSGNYNTITSSHSMSGETKTETIAVDTGSHKALKAGTKACTYSYKSVAEGSDNTANTTYTTTASGGLTITGGTITLDTTHAGLKYNGSGMDNQIILGSPDDAIHSNHTCRIVGGTIDIYSSDDGISSSKDLYLLNNANVNIHTAYEGIESGQIMIGSTSECTQAVPTVQIASNDDGMNASSKSSVSYIYDDESETAYTKKEISASNNTLEILSGNITVAIADDSTHSYSLANANGTLTTGTYTSNGDGIDCNGSFYAYGGTIIVYGAVSNDNSPIDTDNVYYIGNQVTLLAMGSSGMVESPTTALQSYITYGGNSQGFGGGAFRPGGPGNSQGQTSSITANSQVVIADASGNELIRFTAPKTISYILYSSPVLTSNASYQFLANGTTLSTVTAK